MISYAIYIQIYLYRLPYFFNAEKNKSDYLSTKQMSFIKTYTDTHSISSVGLAAIQIEFLSPTIYFRQCLKP